MKIPPRLRYWRRVRRYARAREDQAVDRFIAAIRKGSPVSRYSCADPFELVRTRNGKMIHDAACRWSRTGTPWEWAEDKSIDEVRDTVATLGYATCLLCHPLAR